MQIDMKKVKKESKTPMNALSIILLVLLIVYAVSLFALLFWGLMTAMKDNYNDFILYEDGMYNTNYYGFPRIFKNNISVVWENFKVAGYESNGDTVQYLYGVDVSEGVPLYLLFLNSILYAVGCGLAGTIVPMITAYACAKFNFKFSKVIYTIVIVAMIIPVVGSLPSEMQIARLTGVYNQLWGLWIMKANFLGMYFLVFYNVFRSFPASFSEAAKIDGASNLQILLKIIFPLVKNTFATVFLILFIQFWNDYQVPLLYLPKYPTVARGLYAIMYEINGGDMAGTPARITAAFLVIIPTLILFMIFQKKLLGNLTVGGVKG